MGTVSTSTITILANDDPALNTPPTISDIADQSTNEDTPTSTIAFTIGDAETALNSLGVTATSSNPALVPNGNITLGGTGANRTIQLTPLANQFGTATITVTVTDAGGMTASDTFILTINSVNDAPIAVDDSFTVLPGNMLFGNVLTNDSDIEGDPLSATIAHDPGQWERHSQRRWQLHLSPGRSDSQASDSFTYTLSDGTATSVSARSR